MSFQFPVSVVRIGRGFGLGWNRSRTRQDQLHGGQDFVASEGTLVKAPLGGTVEAIGSDRGPNISWTQATQGAQGVVRGMSGYGNFVVLRHDNMNIPGLPRTFWTSYNHLSRVSVRAGQTVQAGTPLGFSGRTNNGRFRGMGAHLHVELRIRPFFMGSYDRDTVDPQILWNGLGLSLGRPLADYEPPVETDVVTSTSTTSNPFPVWPVIGGAALLLFVLIGGTRDSMD